VQAKKRASITAFREFSVSRRNQRVEQNQQTEQADGFS
jgi:nucleoid DNA-binding protein